MSFFLVEKLSITVQKFFKCLKNGNDRIRKRKLQRRNKERKPENKTFETFRAIFNLQPSRVLFSRLLSIIFVIPTIRRPGTGLSTKRFRFNICESPRGINGAAIYVHGQPFFRRTHTMVE